VPEPRPLRVVPDEAATPAPDPTRRIRALGIGAFGLAWSITTVAAYVPPLLENLTRSTTLVGLVLAAEGGFAIVLPLLVGPLSDATQTPLGRRRPYMLLALLPMAATLSVVPFMPSFWTMALALFGFFFAYYVYEPPYRGLYPDLLPDAVFGKAQGVQHLFRGAAIGGALVGGGFLLAVWKGYPFALASLVTLFSCGSVVLLVREDLLFERSYRRLRSFFAAPWRIIRGNRTVRRWLVANTAWEATFAGMRTFVVLYIVEGLRQPLYVSSVVLAVVAVGYVLAALLAGRFADEFGLGRVILGASVVYGGSLLVASFAERWHWWYVALIAPAAVAGGTVMTLAWGLLFKVMPARDQGVIAGLGITTKGLGLLIGPLAVGATIDIFHPLLKSTEGYAAVWPTVAIPVLAAIPLVALLHEEELRSSPG
jgi:MFS family permease